MNRSILLAVLIGLFVAYAGLTLSESVTPYVSIAEAESSRSTVQVKGLLDERSMPEQVNDEFRFVLKDEGDGRTMPVRYAGVKPDRFDEAHHIVAIGKYDGADGSFHADKLLIKCPSKYENQRGGV